MSEGPIKYFVKRQGPNLLRSLAFFGFRVHMSVMLRIHNEKNP